MRIVIFDAESWEEEGFPDLGPEHQVTMVHEPLSAETARDHAGAECVSVFIYSQVTREVIEALPELRLITTRSTGHDHIDIEACAEREITVCEVPDYGRHTVAEHVFALLLTLSHRMEDAIDRTRKGDFTARGLAGFDLHGRTIGAVGTGDIGLATATIARGFGMRVLDHDIAPDEDAARRIGFEYCDLDSLVSGSDVISLHVPATEATTAMLGEREFAAMKPGAVLINTARGSVVQTRPLIRALAEGRLAGAGLDVLAEEPVVREESEVLRSIYERRHDLDTLLADHMLIRMRNVVVTPHSAFHTREAVQRILDTTADNIRAFAAGRPQHVASA